MKKSGSIALFNSNNVCLVVLRYDKPQHRKACMKRWEEIYGKEKFKTFYVQINPDINEEEVYMRIAV